LRFVVPDSLGMPARPKVGARIRRARQLLDMRQRDLADKLGVSRNTVDSWENDRAYPQRKLARLEEVLGITLEPRDPLAVPLVPENEWEREVLADEELDLEVRRALVLDWRHARDEALAQARREAARKAARSAAS